MRLSLDPDPSERIAIYRWIDENPAHAVAFAKAEMAWEASNRLKSCLVDHGTEDMPEAVGSDDHRPSRRKRFVLGGAIAASLIAALSTVAFQKANDVERYRSPVGEVRDERLADGSTMHLNSGSAAEVRFTDKGRFVKLLSGEVSFDVAHDKNRPFDVRANSAVIRAVGTAFNVRLRESLVELTVTEGIVAVRSAKGKSARVGAGSGAAIRPETVALTRLDPGVIGQRMAWREKLIELDGDTVDQAVAEFNRYRTQPIVIGDARISALRIGGRFRTTDSSDFLSALQVTLPVRVVPGEDGSVMLLHREE